MPKRRILLLLMSILALPGTDDAILAWDFSTSVADWVPYGTAAGEAPAPGTVTWDAGERGGLRICDDAAGRNLYAAAGRVMAVRPGTRCRLRGRYRTAEGPAVIAVMGEGEQGRRNLGSCARLPLPASLAWRPFSTVFTVPAAMTLRVVAHPVAEGALAATGTLWLQAVELAATETTPLDLAPVANRDLRDQTAGDGLGGWTDQGDNDLRGLAPGPFAIGGMTFAIRDPATTGRRAVLALAEGRAGFAAQASVAVNATADRVYLLHAAAWTKARQPVGELVFGFADGSEVAVSVVAGESVGDWWTGDASAAAVQLLPASANPSHSPVHLFAAAIANPRPGQTLTGLRFQAAPAAMWLVLDARLGRGPDLLEVATPELRDRSTWPVFAPGLADRRQPLVDLSRLLDAPAGRHGFVRATGGHFAFADGTPARFLGTNLYPSCWFPSHDQAERFAITLARYGVNLVRLHLPRNALIDRTRTDRQGFISAERWEPFDYLLKQLRDRGIYVVLCSTSGLSGVGAGSEADGIAAGYGECKPWIYWVPRLAELGQRFLAGLLGHVNPYTGLALIDDPGVAMLLLVNEQPPLWWGGAALPEPYRKLLQGAFAAWLRRTWPDRAALAAAWDGELLAGEDPVGDSVGLYQLTGMPAVPSWTGRGAKRSASTVAFLRDLQIAHDRGFRDQLARLGCKVPVTGTNMLLYPAELDGQRIHDFISQHSYYDHVHALSGDLRTGTMTLGNVPFVDLDLVHGNAGLEPTIAAAKVAGMPLVSTESDVMWPHEWRSGYLLTLAATACLQDWDAMLHYSFLGGCGSSWDGLENAPGIFPTVEGNDPAIAGLLPAAALMFHRRDVAPATALVQVVYDAADRLNSEPSLRQPGFPFNYLSHVCRVETVFGAGDGRAAALVGPSGPRSLPWSCRDRERSGAEATRDLDTALKAWGVVPTGRGLDGRRLTSDTGEVVRDWGRSLLTIDTARTQGFSGFTAGPVQLGAVAISGCRGFATVVVSALDDLPIGASRRLLVTTVARAENDSDLYAYGQTVTGNSGFPRGERLVVQRRPGGQVRIEPVLAVLRLAGASATVTALDPRLAALGEPVRVDAAAGAVEIRTSGRSIWHLIEIGPQP